MNDEAYEFVCAKCGAEEELSFDPDEADFLYCQSCYEDLRDEENREQERTSPRKQHGTRVTCNITCAECGEEAELDYVPKGVSLEDALCEDCLREEKGDDSRWTEVRRKKANERKSEWSIECAECGATDYLHFPPQADEDYYCTRCYHQQEEPDDDRLENMQSIGRNVYRPDSEEP